MSKHQMFAVSVFYPRTEGARFDHDYYREKHFELITCAYGDRLKQFVAFQMREDQLDGRPSSHVAAAHFLFATKDEFLKAFDRHRDEITADIANFTDIPPVMEISGVTLASVNVDGNHQEGAGR